MAPKDSFSQLSTPLRRKAAELEKERKQADAAKQAADLYATRQVELTVLHAESKEKEDAKKQRKLSKKAIVVTTVVFAGLATAALWGYSRISGMLTDFAKQQDIQEKLFGPPGASHSSPSTTGGAFPSSARPSAPDRKRIALSNLKPIFSNNIACMTQYSAGPVDSNMFLEDDISRGMKAIDGKGKVTVGSDAVSAYLAPDEWAALKVQVKPKTLLTPVGESADGQWLKVELPAADRLSSSQDGCDPQKMHRNMGSGYLYLPKVKIPTP
jgi:hypothetical protein